MIKTFGYKKSSDEEINTVVDAALDLARARYAGKEIADYSEKNTKVLESLGKKILEGTRYESEYEVEGLKLFNRTTIKNNSTVRDNFNAVITQITTAIVPEVVNDVFQRFIGEIHQVGYGDTARFVIESNDLFKVNSKAEGVRKGVDQPMYDDEITVNAQPYTIDTHIDWYPFASGVFDIGSWSVKIARSFLAFIFLKAVKGMTSATTEFGAAYAANGVSVSLWGTLRSRVSAANGGMPVIAIGTAIGLSNASLSGNYQVQVGEEMNKVGYLDQYLGTPLIALDNVLIPGLANSSATLALNDKIIYMIPVAGQRPVKILFEGDEVAVTFNAEQTSDRSYGISIEMRIGVEAVCGPKYGTITLP